MAEDNFAMGYALGQDSNGGNCNNGNGMWGGDWIWAFLIFALFGWGNGGFGGFGGNNGGGYVATAATQSDIQRGFDTSTIIGKLDGINQGLCDGFYAMNNGMLTGFNNVGNAICNLGYQEAQLVNGINQNITQARFDNQQCCCETQRLMERGFCDAAYAAATNTTNIIQNAHNDTDRIIAKLDAMEMARKDEIIANLRSQVNALNLAQSQANQNATIGAMISASEATILRRTGAECPTAAYIVQPPTPVSFPTNCCGQVNFAGNGCGGCGNCGC